SGTVEEVNSALADDPASVNKDPYGAGWIVKVKITDAGQLDGLLSAGQYKELIG
ncbi:MAG: glycine cleavage system protein H, partial [Flavobacteriales bacterium]